MVRADLECAKVLPLEWFEAYNRRFEYVFKLPALLFNRYTHINRLFGLHRSISIHLAMLFGQSRLGIISPEKFHKETEDISVQASSWVNHLEVYGKSEWRKKAEREPASGVFLFDGELHLLNYAFMDWYTMQSACEIASLLVLNRTILETELLLVKDKQDRLIDSFLSRNNKLEAAPLEANRDLIVLYLSSKSPGSHWYSIPF